MAFTGKTFPEITAKTLVKPSGLGLVYQDSGVFSAPLPALAAGFSDLTELTADVSLTYSNVEAGSVVVVGYDRYEVVASGTSSPDVTTVGGVKLNIVAGSDRAVGLRVTYGGTANAITLTTGSGLPALTTGQSVRFRATAPNTGATTINTDSIGLVSCVTADGTGTTALPADYIRTDVDTVAIYNGTSWVVYREIETGSNANGTYTRWQDGRMESVHQDTTETSTGTGTITRTFPVVFAGTKPLFLSANTECLGTGASSGDSTIMGYTNADTTVVVYRLIGTHDGLRELSTAVQDIHYHEIGTWY